MEEVKGRIRGQRQSTGRVQVRGLVKCCGDGSCVPQAVEELRGGGTRKQVERPHMITLSCRYLQTWGKNHDGPITWAASDGMTVGPQVGC